VEIGVHLDPRRETGRRDPKIYGQFLEHFHRQIYGGLYDPHSPFADEDGMRKDVIQAIAGITPGVVRWPGGCFASAYHWKVGVGTNRRSAYDKAWGVEESNQFGTDEFIRFCRKVNAEPFICTNAGTGTPEEMADWVEYCNLGGQGQWAKSRIANGNVKPYGVKYWSIGNENYGSWEIGAKRSDEWGAFVRESAKAMKAVDPSIELSAASVADMDWNISLLRAAGEFLHWISIHNYWDPLWQENDPSGYETCMTYTLTIGEHMRKIEHILGALGYLGSIRIAFDEWNLRGWHHPRSGSIADDIRARDKNDLNQSYTMADAVFSACFLNQCLAHCNTVGMANFAPLVNARGAIFTHPEGIVLRPTYLVFRLYAELMGDTVIDTWIRNNVSFEVEKGVETVLVPSIDAIGTKTGRGDLQVSVVNRNPDRSLGVEILSAEAREFTKAVLHSVVSPSKDSYNHIEHPDTVAIERAEIPIRSTGRIVLDIPRHSVNVLCLSAG
jgi:alpha-N-arabinofuranosidase